MSCIYLRIPFKPEINVNISLSNLAARLQRILRVRGFVNLVRFYSRCQVLRHQLVLTSNIPQEKYIMPECGGYIQQFLLQLRTRRLARRSSYYLSCVSLQAEKNSEAQKSSFSYKQFFLSLKSQLNDFSEDQKG